MTSLTEKVKGNKNLGYKLPLQQDRQLFEGPLQVTHSVARCGYFPPKWLFWKACGGQKPVASSHHDCGYFWPQNRAICGYFWNCLRIGLFVAIFGLEIEMALM